MAAHSGFDSYVAPARDSRSVWRVICATVVIVLVWVLWTMTMIFARVGYVFLVDGLPPDRALQSAQTILIDGSPGGVLGVLATFFGVWISLWVALKLFHRRPFGMLFAPDRRIHWGAFRAGFALAIAFYAFTLAASLLIVDAPARSVLPSGEWALWLLPLAVGIFFQASAEELLFRGYFLQQLAVWSRNPILWAGLPSLFFGALHLNPAAPLETNLLVGAITALVGLTAAALVWRTGTLAMSMGLHVGVNIPALTLIGAEGGQIGGAQLFLYGPDQTLTLYVIDLIGVLALLALILSPWFPFKARAGQAPAPSRDQPAE